jgi:hypothetical protein
MDKITIKRALINALATAAYVTAVGLFMFYANDTFGKEDKFLTPVVVLMLLVLSAAVTASLVFGQPAMWYVDGRKKQAMQLLGATLGSLAVLTLLAMVGLAAL